MKTKTKMQITCDLSPELRLGLCGIRENYGHDDSIPYQADIYLLENQKDTTGEKYRLVATIWNDGWGGESVIERVRDDSKNAAKANELLKKADELCHKHKLHFQGKPICDYNLRLLCDCMAEAWLYNVKPEYKNKSVIYQFNKTEQS